MAMQKASEAIAVTQQLASFCDAMKLASMQRLVYALLSLQYLSSKNLPQTDSTP
jgi:hypothetical protein